MRPPVCAVCDTFLGEDDKGGIVSFKPAPEDRKWDENAEKNGIIGHPPYLEWFCENHIAVAQQYQHLEREEAMRQITAIIHKGSH